MTAVGLLKSAWNPVAVFLAPAVFAANPASRSSVVATYRVVDERAVDHGGMESADCVTL